MGAHEKDICFIKTSAVYTSSWLHLRNKTELLPGSAFNTCVMLGKLLSSLCFSFIISKMEVLIISILIRLLSD